MAVLLNNSAPSAADLIAIFDAVAADFKVAWPTLGIGLPSESATAVAKGLTARNASISNTVLKQKAILTLDSFARNQRYDVLFGVGLRQLFTDINSLIQQNIPTELSFNASGRTYLDQYLQYLNANGATVPATPTSTLTVSATTGGAIAPTTTGQEPRFKICHIKTGEDWNWSQPSGASNQVALSGKNNAYTFTPTGTVPSDVDTIAVLRQFDGNAGASDPYYLDQFVTATPSAAYPAITSVQPDIMLRQGWTAPSWCQCMLNPETAALIAFALAAPNDVNPFALAAVTSRSLPTPSHVSLGPTNQFCGPGGNSSNLEMGRWVATAYTQGTYQTANNVTQALQGFGGAFGGLSARVISAVNSAASTVQLTYSYKDASNPITPVTGATTSAVAFGATAVGTTINFTIPAGRLVTAVTAITTALTTGTFIVEGTSLRI